MSEKTTWVEKVAIERKRLGREPTLHELIELARTHTMTDLEIAAQQLSWTRQDKD